VVIDPRRLRLPRSLIVAVISATFVAVAGVGGAASAAASPANPAGNGGSAAWAVSGNTGNCPSAMHLLTPTKSASYFASHPSALLRQGEAASHAVQSALAKTAAAHIHWLTRLDCKLGHKHTEPLPQQHPGRTAGTIGSTTSANWSGYETSGTYNYLGASMLWFVPGVSGPSGQGSDAMSSIWPGIGTGNSAADTLIQDGTEQDVVCVGVPCGPAPSYYFWEEAVPQDPYQEEVTNLSVNPGDEVGAIAEYDPSSNQAYFQLTDYTSDQGVYDYESLSGHDGAPASQAEYIVERTEECFPIGGCEYPLLADFSSAIIGEAQAATGANWSDPTLSYPYLGSLDNVSIDMYTCNGQQLDSTEGLDSSSDFAVDYRASGHIDPVNCS
jgi:hypothetical protein